MNSYPSRMKLRSDHPLFGQFLALVAGAVLPLAFAPFNYYSVAPVALALLLYLCLGVSTKTAFIHGYLFGFAYFGVGVNWLHISINMFGGVNLAGALFFTYMLVAFLALYPALCVSLAAHYFKERLPAAFPFLWIFCEWLRGWVLTGLPWLNIGTSQTDSPLVSYVPLVGDYGLSLIVASLASFFVVLVTGGRKQRIISAASIGVLLTSPILLKSVNWTQVTGDSLEVALIQGAIPQAIKWQQGQRRHTLETYSALSRPYWGSDLIIWPETAIPSFYRLADDFLERISQEKKDSDTIFMSGLAYQDQQTEKYFNSILIIDGAHRFYHKHKLVPFGEYLPLKAILDKPLRLLKIPIPDFSPGDVDNKILITGRGTFGMSICYEDVYAEEIRNSMPQANILINVSNDAWFGDSLAQHQHLQIARMRAIENGRYMLRATNTGISAIIDAHGKVITRSPQFKPHALTGHAQLYSGITPYSRWGDNPLIILCLLALIYLRRS